MSTPACRFSSTTAMLCSWSVWLFLALSVAAESYVALSLSWWDSTTTSTVEMTSPLDTWLEPSSLTWTSSSSSPSTATSISLWRRRTNWRVFKSVLLRNHEKPIFQYNCPSIHCHYVTFIDHISFCCDVLLGFVCWNNQKGQSQLQLSIEQSSKKPYC